MTVATTTRAPTFLATTTNGSGMGHLSRQLAVAAALTGRAEPVLFSLSTALATVLAGPPPGPSAGPSAGPPAGSGPRGEYCPSYHRHQMPVPYWHAYLRDRLVALVRETGAGAVGFDGVTPYLGLLRARALLPEVPFVWFRRGMWRPGANLRALRAAPFFDVIVEPGDLAAGSDRGATARRDDAVRVPPICSLSHVPHLAHEPAARQLGLDPDRPAVLVNLGAWAHRPARPGAGWWTSIAAQVVRQLLAGTDWQIALTRAPIVDSEVGEAQTERLVVLHDVYPLASHLAAFEAAVAEAGYNGFHELLLAGVPTLFLPKATSTDDQPARGRWAAGAGTALYADDPAHCSTEVARLLDTRVREDLRTVCSHLDADDGSAAAADLVLGALDRHGSEFRHRASTAERRRIAVLEGKAAVSRVIGPSATDRLRSLRGPVAAPGARGPARRVACDPLLTTEVDGDLLRGSRPVEHLLRGTGPAYRRERIAIAARYHRVPPGWPDTTAPAALTDGRGTR
jgi:hypothetical protein